MVARVLVVVAAQVARGLGATSEASGVTSRGGESCRLMRCVWPCWRFGCTRPAAVLRGCLGTARQLRGRLIGVSRNCAYGER